MRLDKEISTNGKFWIAGFEQDALSGRMTVSDGGRAVLELLGIFNEHSDLAGGHLSSYHCIAGHLEGGEYVSLERCIYTRRTFVFGGLDISIFVCNYVTLGVALDDQASVLKYDWATFAFEGLESFSLLGGFYNPSPENDDISLAYKPPETFSVEIYESCKLHFSCGWNFVHGDPVGSSVTIKTKPGLCLTYETAQDSDIVRRDIAWVQRFLILAFGECVNLRDVKGYTKLDGRDYGVQWYYESRPFNPQQFVHNKRKLLFNADQLGSGLEGYLQSWFALRDVLSPPVNLYLSCVSHEGYVADQRFLYLAQAVEPLYRILYPKMRDVPYSEQVFCLASYVGEAELLSVDVDCFSEVIKDSRNYLTHYNPKDKSKVPVGRDFLVMSSDMRGLIVVTMLRAIGFLDQDITDAAKRGRLFQMK